MKTARATCNLCTKEFFFDPIKRKQPKYCNMQCYIRRMETVEIEPIETQETWKDYMFNHDWIINLGISLVLALIAVLIGKYLL